MPRKSKNKWKETLHSFQIHMKTGREKFLSEVARAYEMLYPAKARFFRSALKNLRQVTTSGYKAGKAGDMYVSIRVPTELWCYIQRWIPDFGQDSKDVELLSKVWCDLVKGRDYRRRTTFYICGQGNVQETEPKTEEGSGEEVKEGTEADADSVYTGDEDRSRSERESSPPRIEGADFGGDDCEGLCGVSGEDSGKPSPSIPLEN